MSAPIPVSLPSQLRADCPSHDLMWQVIQGETGHETTFRVIEHCGQCPRCAEQWREMCELSMELSDAVGQRPPSFAPQDTSSVEETTPLPFSSTLENQHGGKDTSMDSKSKAALIAIAVLALLMLLF